MNLVIQPNVDMRGNITDKPSSYNPDKGTKDRLAQLRSEFEVSEKIRNKSYREFNNRNLIQYQNDCQAAFNTYVPPKSNDPDELWKAQTKSAVTRNKVISIAAHVTASVLYPNVTAQNENDSEDRDAAEVMKDMMDWTLDQSNYERNFVNAVISACVNPAVIIHEDYKEVLRDFKEIQEDGTWKTEKRIDDVYSGFQNCLVPVDELFIGSIYTYDIQKQPFLIWRRYIDYSQAAIKYGDNANFKRYVRPGVRHYYDDATSSFYEQYDQDLEGRLVEEIVYYNRSSDLEITIVNGIMLDSPNQPLKRQDKKYPFSKSGYEQFDEGQFFYYKSLCDKMAPDQDTVDTLYNMIIDGTKLQITPPMVNSGPDIIDSSVVIPGMVTSLSEGSKLEAVGANGNLSAGYSTLDMVLRDIAESSQDPRQSGIQSRSGTTAFEVARLEQNSRTMLGLFGKMIIQLVEDFGRLRLKTILQYMPVSLAKETMSPSTFIKFNNLLVGDRDVEGKKMPRRIEFTVDMPETEEDEQRRAFELMAEEESKGIRIAQVNPTLFMKMDFDVKLDADFVGAQSEAVKKALKLEAYDRAINNPLVAQDVEKLAAVTKDFLFANYAPGDEDKYVNTEARPPQQQQAAPVSSEVIGQVANTGEQPLTQAAI